MVARPELGGSCLKLSSVACFSTAVRCSIIESTGPKQNGHTVRLPRLTRRANLRIGRLYRTVGYAAAAAAVIAAAITLEPTVLEGLLKPFLYLYFQSALNDS